MPQENKDLCYLLLGEDNWSKNKFIKEVKNKVIPPESEMMNYIEFKDKEINIAKLAEHAETLPFFADKKMIYIKDSGLLKPGKKEESDKFESFVKELPSYLVLLIDEREADKRSKLYKTLQSRYSVITFDYPGEEAVLEMLEEKVEQNSIAIKRSVLQYFLRNMPEDINYIIEEFEKLTAYAGGLPVTQAIINEVCVFALEKRVFELVKRIADRNAAEAFQIYQNLIQGKESPIGILVLIARQFRMMLQIKYLLKNNLSQKEIASKVKMPYFALKEIIAQVNHYTFKRLEDILEMCLDTDKAIKSGQMDSVKRVEILIIECLNK